MSIHINEVLDHLEAHPIRYCSGVGSVLEMVHDVYCEYNLIDSEGIKLLLREFEDVLKKLPAEDTEQLSTFVAKLCWEHERLAFSHGVLVGMHLMTEVNYLP